jgi:hypothetical protein
MFEQANKTIRKKTFYKMHIVKCSKCNKKFRINRNLKRGLEFKNKKLVCPICSKHFKKRYLMISKKEEEAIKRLHKAQGCIVRKMTNKEKQKYLNN